MLDNVDTHDEGEDIPAKAGRCYHHCYSPCGIMAEVEIVKGERRDNLLKPDDIHGEGADKQGDTSAAEDYGEDGAGGGQMEMAGHHSTRHDGEGDHLHGGGDDYEGGYWVGEGGGWQ